MNKFLLLSDREIDKLQFNFQVGETANGNHNRCYCIVDTHSNQAIKFALLDGAQKMCDQMCDQMNRAQSWGTYLHYHVNKYTLL